MTECKIRAIITLTDHGDTTTQEDIENLGEMMSYLDASFSFNSKYVIDCDQCDNGIFYFTRDNLLKDSQICGKCKGKGEIDYA